MSFPTYPKYKDSGVEWLGEVPEHWAVTALKYLVSMASGGGITGETIDETGEYPVFGGNGLRGYTNNFTHHGEYVLIGRQGALCGNINYAKGKFWASEHAVVVTQRHDMDTHWLGEILRSMNLNQYSVTAAQPGLSMEMVGNLRTIVPPLPEQRAIASFLDHETAKIDALVAEQQRLIELLKEKRQAVISHAVTKGLNPNVRMKPSGIEWLGDVPEHWEVLKGSLIGELFGSDSVGEESVVSGGNVPFIKVGSMASDGFNIQSWDWYVDVSLDSQLRPRKNYVVFPKRGAAIFLNKVNVVTRPSLIDPNLMGWQINERADSLYVAYLLKTRKLDELADVSTVPQINNKHILPERFPIPPVAEQAEIVDYLNTMTSRFASLIAEAHSAIALLQERRTALISAAVTGKIDVRCHRGKEVQ